MKRSAIVVILILFLCPSAYAIPLVYKFEGIVTNAGFAEQEYINDFGPPPNGFLATGDIVYHKVLIEYDLTSIPDYSEIAGPVAHEFSAQYISGTAMIEPNSNYGYNVFNTDVSPYAAGQLFGGWEPSGLGDSLLAIWNWDLTVYEWTVGTPLIGHSHLGPYGSVYESLTLSSINNPVPEPSTIFLLSLGAIGFLGKRKFSKNK